MQNVDTEFKLALQEVGPIEPVWAEGDGVYVFEHEAYPFVMGGGPTVKEARNSYRQALKDFIEARLNGQLAPVADKMTSGRGGLRPGSGRPKNNIASIRISIPQDVGQWLQSDPKHIEQVRRLMA